MSYSLGEVEATARKAARARGFDWGTAAEAGRAARWLEARDMEGCAALARYLDLPALGGAPSSVGGPVVGSRHLCPLLSGLAVADAARTLPSPIRIGPMLSPLLFVPFAAMVAADKECAVLIEAASALAVTDGRDADIRADGWPARGEVLLRVVPGAGLIGRNRHRSTPPRDAWSILERLARRTYAPATEVSRTLGAGAGLTDND